MLEFLQALLFDLPNPFTSNLETSGYFFQRVRLPVDQSESHKDDFALAVGEGAKNVIDSPAQNRAQGRFCRGFTGAIDNELS